MIYYDIFQVTINLKTLLKTKEELKRIKVTFISEPAGKICSGLKDFCPKKPSQVSDLTAGNLGGHCKPPDEVQGAEFRGN